jgi:colanic acid/amylovoran biosynthesis glycosyltransferase
MRIAFVVGAFPLVSETFILNQITGLLDRGHAVDIFASGMADCETVHPDVERYRLLERTRFPLVVPSNRFIRLLKALVLLVTNFHKNPRASLESLNAFKHGRNALSLDLFYQTVPFLERYDIVHCQFGTNGKLGAVLKERGLQKRLVTTFHGYDTRLAIQRGADIYSNLFDQCDCFIAVSAYNYENFVNWGVDPSKVVYHPVGIDLNRFCYRGQAESFTGSRPIKVLTVARLVQEKGLQYGIRAIAKLLQQSSKLSLEYHIIGDGPLKEELTELIAKLGLQVTVCLQGARSQGEIIAALQDSDIFLFPSVAEALPVALMEAQAVGLPVIATAVGSTNQIVVDKESGFLVPPGNVDALVEKLKYLIENSDEWRAMGRAGRMNIEKQYDIDKLNDRLVTLYEGLLVDGGRTTKTVGQQVPCC